MTSPLRRMMDSFRGAGESALTVPPLDGAFRPNSALDGAELITTCDTPDNLVDSNGVLYATSRGDLMRLADGKAEAVANDLGKITAMAAGEGGRLAVASGGGRIRVVGSDLQASGAAIESLDGDVTALAFSGSRHLVVAVGAASCTSDQWQRDLMEHGRSGSLWLVDIVSGDKERIATGLAYPAGVAVTGEGDFLVSLAWEHAVVRIDRAGKRTLALGNLPAYPWRLAPATDGFWLALAAPRNQLVELTLREGRFRREMLRGIEPQYWIAPQLSRAQSPLEVMQAGAERIGGNMKPWAPSLSYGLVCRIDRSGQPEETFHSRADGKRHGITSMIQQGGRLLAASQGANAIIGLDVR